VYSNAENSAEPLSKAKQKDSRGYTTDSQKREPLIWFPTAQSLSRTGVIYLAIGRTSAGHSASTIDFFKSKHTRKRDCALKSREKIFEKSEKGVENVKMR
jgi:hypothetical protein